MSQINIAVIVGSLRRENRSTRSLPWRSESLLRPILRSSTRQSVISLFTIKTMMPNKRPRSTG